MHPNSPQAAEMADESMVRNLAAQIEAIWPQEEPIFARHAPSKILDVGCGTGEVAPHLLRKFPGASYLGVDVEEAHLARARARCAPFGERAQFKLDDAMALSFPDAQFDLCVSRHVLQALPDAGKALSELVRVLKPGGRLHALAEDYGMLWCHPTSLDSDGFWQRIPQRFGAAIGSDLHVGRKMFSLLQDLRLEEIRADYLTIDTLRVPREVFARIWEAWRDGYTEGIVQHSGVPRAEVEERWREMIACVRDPRGYALWQIPVWTARKP